MSISNLHGRVAGWMTTDHIEVTLRLTASFLLGYSLSVAYIPTVIPPANAFLLSFLVPLLGMLMPTLVFSWAGLIIPFFTLFLMSWGMSSGLLAAAVAGGDGAFIAAFAAVSLWLSSLRFEKATGSAVSLAVILIVFNTVLLFPNHRTVQDGFALDFTVGASVPPNGARPIIQQMQELYGPPLRELAAEAMASGQEQTLYIEDFNVGCVSGIDVQVNINATEDGTLQSTALFPPGMWQIKSTWKCRGTNNPLAVYYNMVLMMLWLFVILAVVSLTPPWRTMRGALSRTMIPAALRDAAKHIRLHYDSIDADEEEKEEEGEDGGSDGDRRKLVVSANIEENKKEQIQAKQALTRGGIIKYTNVLFGGKMAYFTAFEPRLLRFGPPECSYELLVHLSNTVSTCGIVAMGIEELIESKKDVLYHREAHLQAAKKLEQCASSLMTGTMPANGDEPSGDEEAPANEVKSTLKGSILKNGKPSIVDESPLPDACRLMFHADNVLAATNAWIRAMGPPKRSVTCCFTKDALVAVMKNIKPHVRAHSSFLKRLLRVIFVTPFQASSWQDLFHSPYINLIKVGWCIKFSLGMTALVTMTVFWPEFKTNFVVSIGENASAIASANSGWAIVAYCFATTQTSEGTVTKGLLRLTGTVFGAFCGWVGLHACQDSSFQREFNPYGIIAWLTISSSAAVFVSTERGFMARLGLSADYMFGPMYFVVTEVIVVMYCFLFTGVAGIHDVTINRMASNLVGIAVALILGFLPPCLWGGDPRYCKSIAQRHRKNIVEYLSLFLAGMEGGPNDGKAAAEKMAKLRQSHMSEDIMDHDLVSDFYTDAARLRKLRLFMVDPRLKLELVLTARDISIVSYIPSIAERLLVNPVFRRKFTKNREELMPFLDYFLRTYNGEKVEKVNHSVPKKEPEEDEGKVTVGTKGLLQASAVSTRYVQVDNGESEGADVYLELFFRILEMLEGRLLGREEVLDKIHRGYIGGC